MEYIWARIKGGYATRYDDVGVREHVQRFCDELSEDDLAKIVDHCDKAAHTMVEDEAALFLDDDIAPDPGGSDDGLSDDDDGAMPDV